MRLHELDLQHIDALLRDGWLAEATTNAFWLAYPHPDEIMSRWPVETARAKAAAQQLSTAADRGEALRAEARVAAACGDCHVRAGATPAFERDVQIPRDDGTAASRLRRHRWAAARLFDGAVGGSDRQWRAGLEVFAEDIAGYRVHVIASRALVTDEGREVVHARLLEACTACHPSVLQR